MRAERHGKKKIIYDAPDTATGFRGCSGNLKNYREYASITHDVFARGQDAFKQGGMSLILAGLLLIAFDIAVLELVRVAGYYLVSEGLTILIMGFGFYLVFRGVIPLREGAIEYQKIYVTSIACMVLMFLQLALTLINVMKSLGYQAFIDITTVFIWYVAIMGMLYIYFLLMSRNSVTEMKMGTASKSTLHSGNWIKTYLLILIALALLPFMKVFWLPLTWVLTIILAIVFIWPQLTMCGWIGAAYDNVNGGLLAVKDEKESKNKSARARTGDKKPRTKRGKKRALREKQAKRRSEQAETVKESEGVNEEEFDAMFTDVPAEDSDVTQETDKSADGASTDTIIMVRDKDGEH